MTSRKLMNIDQSYIRALVGQTIHRNGLWLQERVVEDMPGASVMYAKLEKHNVDQLRRWLLGRGKRSGNKTALVVR